MFTAAINLTPSEFSHRIGRRFAGKVAGLTRSDRNKSTLIVVLETSPAAPVSARCRVHGRMHDLRLTVKGRLAAAAGSLLTPVAPQFDPSVFDRYFERRREAVISTDADTLFIEFDGLGLLTLPLHADDRRPGGIDWVASEPDGAQCGRTADQSMFWSDALSSGPGFLPPAFGQSLAPETYNEDIDLGMSICNGNCWDELASALNLRENPSSVITFCTVSISARWFARRVDDLSDLLRSSLRDLFEIWRDPGEPLYRRCAACLRVTAGAHADVRDLMLSDVHESERELRWICAYHFHTKQQSQEESALSDLLICADADVRCAAAYAAGGTGHSALIGRLLERSGDDLEDLQVRLRSLHSLALGRVELPPQLAEQLLDDQSSQIRYWGCYALAAGGGMHVARLLRQRLDDEAEVPGWGSVSERARWELKSAGFEL